MTLDDVRRQPDPEWLVARHLCRGTLSVLFGPSGSGKSLLALDVALSVAAGRPLHGFPVKAGAVAYVYSEGASGIKSRERAWREGNGVADLPHGAIRFYPESIDFTDPAAVSAFAVDLTGDFGRMPDLVIVDTLARNFGGGDENSTRDMNQFVAGVDRLRAAGAAVLVVHHSGKGGGKSERGSSALRAAADTVFAFTKLANGTLRVACDKMKDGQPFAARSLAMVPHRFGTDEDGQPVSAVHLVPVERDAKKDMEAKLPAAALKMLDALRSMGGSGKKTEIRKKAGGMNNDTATHALESLINEGFVIESDERDADSTRKTYRLAEPVKDERTGHQKRCPVLSSRGPEGRKGHMGHTP